MQPMTVPLFVTLLGASTWAVREDLLEHRIPNRLTGSLLFLGVTLQLALGGWSALGDAALGFVVGLVVLLPLYLVRATGAGDVKLLAALGTLLGPYWILVAGLYTLIAGGALALGYLLHCALRAAIAPVGVSWPLRIQHGYERVQQLRRKRFPYALAIAIGAVGAAAQRGDLRALFDYLCGVSG